MSNRIECAIVLVLSAIGLSLLWLSQLPLGISGEWTWTRIPLEHPQLTLLSALPAVAAGLVLCLIAREGRRRIGNAGRRGVAAWLIVLSICSIAWLFCVQDVPSGGHSLSKAPLVLYYPGSSGYYVKVRDSRTQTDEAQASGLIAFLHDYEELMDEGDVLHVGTHPPGLFVLYFGLFEIVESSSPDVIETINATMPSNVAAGFDAIGPGLDEPEGRVSEEHRCVLWLAIVISHLSAAGCVIPMFLLIRITHSREAAWSAVCWWPLVPAVAVFLPKSDVLFSGLAALLLCLWILAVRKKSLSLALAAGLVGWVGLFCSLAFLPIGLMALLASWSFRTTSDDQDNSMSRTVRIHAGLRALIRPLAGGVVAVALPTLAAGFFFEMNLLKVWTANYRNHAAFYSQFDRTWWKWLLVNPLELALAVGIPLVWIAGTCIWSSLRSCRRPSQVSAFSAAQVSVVAIWTLLWLSGKNSGEAARLWVPLMPLLIWAAAGTEFSNRDDERAISRRSMILLALQAICCLMTVLRVSGFHF